MTEAPDKFFPREHSHLFRLAGSGKNENLRVDRRYSFTRQKSVRIASKKTDRKQRPQLGIFYIFAGSLISHLATFTYVLAQARHALPSDQSFFPVI